MSDDHIPDLNALRTVFAQAEKRDVDSRMAKELLALDDAEWRRLSALSAQYPTLDGGSHRIDETQAETIMRFLRDKVPEKDWVQVIWIAAYLRPTPLGKWEWLAIVLALLAVVLAMMRVLWR